MEHFHSSEMKKAPFIKICPRCPALVKFGTVIPYLKNIKKIHKSCDIPLSSADAFCHRNSELLPYQEIQI